MYVQTSTVFNINYKKRIIAFVSVSVCFKLEKGDRFIFAFLTQQ